MIISTISLTLLIMGYLAPTWILILRHKPQKAVNMLLFNLVGAPFWIVFVVYACLA